jgi:hypothetical protein
MEDNLYHRVYGFGLIFDYGVEAKVHLSFVELQMLACTKINYPKLTSILRSVPKDLYKDLFSLLIFIRNPRGGLGRRQVGRFGDQWLLINFPVHFRTVINEVHEKGRWDDIYWLFPGALKLDNIDFVRRNYDCEVSHSQLVIAREVQSEIVQYVASVFLESFSNYMQGKPYDQYFVKWLPSEKSRLNRRFGIIGELCKELRISLVDYRVIYVSPMRKKLYLTESLVCKSDWDSIDFDKAGKKCVKTLHRALMEKSSSYRNWRSVTSRGYFIQPKFLIQSYLQEISSQLVANSEREIEWSKTINLARQCFLGNAAVIVDTRGGMYSPLNKIDKRTVSFLAVAMGLAASCSAKGENFAYTFRKPQGFTRHDFNMSLLDTINRIRSSFSDYPKIDEIFNHIRISFKESNPQTVIYVGATRPKYTKSKKKSEFKSPLLIWWHITSKKVSFEKLKWEKKDLVIISGFTRDIYNYLMMYGNYNPHTTVQMVTQGTNSK